MHISSELYLTGLSHNDAVNISWLNGLNYEVGG